MVELGREEEVQEKVEEVDWGREMNWRVFITP